MKGNEFSINPEPRQASMFGHLILLAQYNFLNHCRSGAKQFHFSSIFLINPPSHVASKSSSRFEIFINDFYFHFSL